MVMKRTKTYSAKASELTPKWHVLDAAGKPLGRLATDVARILQGKHKPTYTAHLLSGDFVIVVNAAQVAATGNKPKRKVYYHYSGFHSGLKSTTLEKLLATHPERAIQHAVRGMLPKNALSRHMLTRLKVYAGAEHPHQAQVAARPKERQEAVQPQEAKE